LNKSAVVADLVQQLKLLSVAAQRFDYLRRVGGGLSLVIQL